MTRRFLSLLLALCLCLAMPLMANGEEAALTVTDMMGREITLEGPAQRVVALTAADCEIIYALGAQDLLVGRGSYCDYPEAVLEVPVVDSGAETNLEQILALEPDVLIMAAMAQTTEQVEALENAGVKVIVSNAQDIAGTYEAISLIGAICGKDAEAAALVADMQASFQAIADKAEDTGKTVYFEVSPLEWGLWTAGKNTFMDELATLCGVTNAFADVDGWAEISEEQVLDRNPDYIVTNTMYYGEGPTPGEEIASRAGWEAVTAVQLGNIYNADSNAESRPGPRLVQAAEELYNFFYGETAAEDDAA